MTFIRLLIATLVLGLSAQVRAQSSSDQGDGVNPKSVFLSHFNWERPDAWRWVTTQPHTGSILMEVIFTAPSDDQQARIYINHAQPSASSTISSRSATFSRWKSWMDKPHEMGTIPAKQIGSHKVSFVEYAGTYTGPAEPGSSSKRRPNFSLFGAHIEDKDGNILIRMVGPTTLVAKNKAGLRKMIEDALEVE